MGLEPIRDFSHQHLKLARLPIPPEQHIWIYLSQSIKGYRSYGEFPVASFSYPPSIIRHSVCFFFSGFWLIWYCLPDLVVHSTPVPHSEAGSFLTTFDDFSFTAPTAFLGITPPTLHTSVNHYNQHEVYFGTPNEARTRIAGLRGRPPIPI